MSNKKVTISDFIATNHKEMPFEERAQKFGEAIEPLTKEWGVTPWAGIQSTPEAIYAVPLFKDLWPKEQ